MAAVAVAAAKVGAAPVAEIVAATAVAGGHGGITALPRLPSERMELEGRQPEGRLLSAPPNAASAGALGKFRHLKRGAGSVYTAWESGSGKIPVPSRLPSPRERRAAT